MKDNLSEITRNIFEIKTEQDFRNAAMEIFRFQSQENIVYKNYIHQLCKKEPVINTIEEIPFLPIDFFKTTKIVSGYHPASVTFSSSGTTGTEQSHHEVCDVSLYEKSYRYGFHYFYGEPKDYCILALMPSYLERQGSSLIYMMNDLVKRSEHPKSGFYLFNHDELIKTLRQLQEARQKTILWGVTFALLDFIEKYPIHFPELIVMETGGMKGRRKEMIREEVHLILRAGFGIPAIHSEYGMTELLSQAYSNGEGLFETPPWMRILIRDTNDPLKIVSENQTGGINIIDLANIFSCSFIASQDLGKINDDGKFEVLGRFDQSDIRGCNLMVE